MSQFCTLASRKPLETLLVTENRSLKSESKEKSGGTALDCYCLLALTARERGCSWFPKDIRFMKLISSI